jgi:hypothetical protein
MGISGKQVSDSQGESTSDWTGLYAEVAQNCRGTSKNGIGLRAYRTALNCYGFSESDTGLLARSAQNCYGESGGGGVGLYSDVANNCQGYSVSGIGLRCPGGVATGCLGSSTSSLGLGAKIAIGCIGVGTPPYDVQYKYNMP